MDKETEQIIYLLRKSIVLLKEIKERQYAVDLLLKEVQQELNPRTYPKQKDKTQLDKMCIKCGILISGPFKDMQHPVATNNCFSCAENVQENKKDPYLPGSAIILKDIQINKAVREMKFSVTELGKRALSTELPPRKVTPLNTGRRQVVYIPVTPDKCRKCYVLITGQFAHMKSQRDSSICVGCDSNEQKRNQL